MKEEKTLEEQLRDIRISKDDPKALKKRIEELEAKLQQSEHEKTLGPNEKICPILKRETGDGRIEVVNKKVTCEYSFIYKTAYSGTKYSTCKVKGNACPYTGLPGESEVDKHW